MSFNHHPVIKSSRMGFKLTDDSAFNKNFQLIWIDSSAVDQTWKPVWAEVSSIRNHHKEIIIHLKQKNEPGKKYMATVYRDASNADWKSNPEAYKIEKFVVDSKSKLTVLLANGGGAVICITPAKADDLKKVKKYK